MYPYGGNLKQVFKFKIVSMISDINDKKKINLLILLDSNICKRQNNFNKSNYTY